MRVGVVLFRALLNSGDYALIGTNGTLTISRNLTFILDADFPVSLGTNLYPELRGNNTQEKIQLISTKKEERLNKGKKMQTLLSNRFVQGGIALLVVVVALIVRNVVTPTFAENLQFLCGGQAQVQFESEIVSKNIAYDALRVDTPAPAIGIENADKLVKNLCKQAELLNEEMTLRLASEPDADTDDIEKAMTSLRKRYESFIEEQAKFYEYRQEILDLYKVVSGLPKYSKAQNQALKACEAALEKGEWQKAKTECEKAQDLAVPPTPTHTPAPATTPTALPIIPVVTMTPQQ